LSLLFGGCGAFLSLIPYGLGAPRLSGDPGAPREADHKDIQFVLGRSLDAFLAKGVAGKLGRYETTMQRQLSAGDAGDQERGLRKS
jgi:hypothetical protein